MFRSLINRLNDGRGVTASTGTAVLARAASSLTVLIAMPIALRSLGEARFGAFLLLFGLINWMLLGTFGIQSALGRAIASGTVKAQETPGMLGSATIYAVFTSGITALLVGIAFLVWLNTAGRHIGLPMHEMIVGGFLMLVLSFVQIILQTFEGVQIGNLQIYVSNLTRVAGSMFTFVCLIVLPRHWSSIAVFVIALNGGLLFGSAVNSAIVLKRVGITFANIRENISRLRHLAVSGLAFLLIGMAALLETHVPVIILATVRGPVAAVDFGLFIRLLYVLIGVLAMITAPLWPAIMSARAEANYGWIVRSVRVAGFLVIGAGVASMLLVASFGGQILAIWAARKMTEGSIFQILFGIYFAQMAWAHFWGVVLIGFGRERFVATILIAEGCLILILGGVFAAFAGAIGMIGGAVCALACVSNWAFPICARRALSGATLAIRRSSKDDAAPRGLRSAEEDWA